MFWWILLACTWFSDWGACDGPPAHVVGAVGADPCGLLPVDIEGTALGTLFSVDCWSIEDGALFAAFLG